MLRIPRREARESRPTNPTSPTRITQTILLLACAYTTAAQCPAAKPLVIKTVTTTESRCEASGTATVSASGGSTPYTYSIIAGPSLAPSQSSNILQSLAPGTYTVQVTDNCNTSVTKNITIAGTYNVPAITLTTTMPGCPGSSDGSITITATNGRAPLKYALISPSPVIKSPQTSNVFTGLPVGTYYAQVSDSCGNIQTQTVTLAAAPSTIAINGTTATLQYVACDSFDVYIPFNITNYKPPYTVTATLPGGKVVTQVLTAPAVNSGTIIDTLPIHYAHVTGATDVMSVTITNECGVSSTNTITLSTNMDLSANSTLASSCGLLTYTFDIAPQLHCPGVTYTLISPSGTVLATQTANPEFTGYPPGSGYKVIRTDCCGSDTLVFNWATAPPFQITYNQNLSYGTCLEGTTSLYITFNYSDPLEIVLVSGPPSVTLLNGTVYPFTYPDTIQNVYSGSILGYFGPGTYKLYAIDPVCGQKDSLTKTFGSADVRQTTFGASLEKGCGNANKILLNVTSNGGWTPGTITVNSTSGQLYNNYVENPASSFSDSVQNLSAGTYYAAYQFSNYYGPTYIEGTGSLSCDLVTDTIAIPAYTNPSFSPAAAVALCGTNRQVALLPDTTTGVPPFEYQIISGPTTTALQSSPVFTGLSAGTYTFQMVDACANSYSRSIAINTLAIPDVATTGNTCLGGAATFTLPASPFFNYTWQLPNGSTSSGNTLTIDPVSSSDIGTYQVSLTSTIAGCTNTTTENFGLNSCQVLADPLLNFAGQWDNDNIQLTWQIAADEYMSYYVVQRSTDDIMFTTLAQLNPTNTTSQTQNTYHFTDTHVPTGTVYYRLQLTQASGASTYSSTISFSNAGRQPFIVYPSVIFGNTPVTVSYPLTSQASTIRVIGIDGTVWQTIPITTGATKTSIDITNLARGNYFIVLTSNGNIMTAQISKDY